MNTSQQTQPFFSIIVPVFNTQAYLPRCLDSCLAQGFQDFELLIVDDCGSDGSMQIASNYAKHDARIRILHNPHNLGLFHTRIAGEKEANGHYILHLDSDDFIHPHTCEILYQALKQDYLRTGEWSDLCCFGMDFEPKTLLRVPCKVITQTLKGGGGDEILEHYFIRPTTLPWAMWNKAYRNTLIQNTNRFIAQNLPDLPHITMTEDVLKSFIIALCARSSIGIHERLYYYCDSTSSITRDKNETATQRKIKEISSSIHALAQISPSSFPHLKLFERARHKTQRQLQAMLELEFRYQDGAFAYPRACLRSLRYVCFRWQTFARLLAYCLSLGRIKL